MSWLDIPSLEKYRVHALTIDPEKARIVDDQYLAEIVKLRPEVGDSLGIGAQDALPDPSRDAHEELLGTLDRWRDERDISVNDDRTYTMDLRDFGLDQRVFSASIELFRFAHSELPVTRDPESITDIAQVLATQLYAPIADDYRFEGLSKRLALMPAYLRKARSEGKFDPFLLEAASHSPERFGALLDLVSGRARAALESGTISNALMSDIDKAVSEAHSGVDAHKTWLGEREAGDRYEPGAENFDHILHLRGLDISAQEMAELARSMAEEMRIEERRLASRAFRNQTPIEALAYARGEMPNSAAEAVAWLTKLLDVAREFVAESGAFASLPDEEIDIVPSPPTISGLLPSIHLIPACGEDEPRPARLVLSIPSDDAFANLSLADLENLVSAHGYPGRHLFSLCSHAYNSIIRRGAPTGIAHPIASTWGHETRAGWAHHSEELMRELAFRESPSSRLITVRYGLYRAVLALVDVGLGTGSFTREQAVGILAKNGGASAVVATRDVVRCVRKPGWGLSALLGKMRLQQVRREAKTQWRHAYSDRRFHDLALKGGPIPLTYLFELVEEPPPFDDLEGELDDAIMAVGDDAIVALEDDTESVSAIEDEDLIP